MRREISGCRQATAGPGKACRVLPVRTGHTPHDMCHPYLPGCYRHVREVTKDKGVFPNGNALEKPVCLTPHISFDICHSLIFRSTTAERAGI